MDHVQTFNSSTVQGQNRTLNSAEGAVEPLNLERFARFFLSLDFASMRSREFYDYGSVLSLILYRDGPFQAELFIVRPNLGFPRDHRHPDVDSVEYCLSPRIPLIVNGEDLSRGQDNRGAQYHVSQADWHRVGDVPNGGQFLSLQEWNNGVAPTSVGLNWEGAPVSQQHKELLRRPDAKWVKTIKRSTVQTFNRSTSDPENL